jgi:hypothetical protein
MVLATDQRRPVRWYTIAFVVVLVLVIVWIVKPFRPSSTTPIKSQYTGVFRRDCSGRNVVCVSNGGQSVRVGELTFVNGLGSGSWPADGTHVVVHIQDRPNPEFKDQSGHPFTGSAVVSIEPVGH